MTSYLIVALFFFSSLSINASQQVETYSLLEQGEYVASSQEALSLKEKCENKKNSVSCYDYAVHLAQTIDDEAQSVRYYQRGCDLKYEAACFNLGGILIKKMETRSEGIKAFQKSCLAAKDAKASSEKKEVLKVACDLIPILEKHMTAPYPELYEYLKAANPPPHREKKGRVIQKSEPGFEALKQMNLSLDKRLMGLKKSDPKEFKQEMELQKLFNESVKKFCAYYENACEGSVCVMCVDRCYSAFYFYRKGQAEEINASNLVIESNIASTSVAEKYFGSFAKDLCQMPESIWKKSTRPIKCSTTILAGLQSKVISTMSDSKVNEGDVCAQLSN